MKKIFYFIASAIVALGAVACQNNIDDTVAPDQQGEGVSIRVTIADQTRVSLGDFEEGKGYKLSFEEGDQICVSNSWGGTGTEADYWFTYTKTEGDTYVFTCTADGVGALVGTEQNVFYFGGAPAGNGSVRNTAKEDISGVGMNGGTSAFGTEPIVLSVLPVLKYSSEYPVTFTASTGTFSSEAGRWATSYTATKTGSDIYIPMYSTGTYTLTASILGQEVKSKEITFEKNKIYNLGTIEAPEIEKDEANITIDGVFTDWEDVTKAVATTTGTQLHTLKAYVDENNIYIYVEFDPEGITYLDMFFDMDSADATGNSYAWQWSNKANIRTEGKLYDWPDGVQTPYEYLWPSKKVYNEATAAWETDSTLSITANVPVSIGENISAAELALARTESVNAMLTGDTLGVGVFLMKQDWSSPGYLPTNGTMLSVPVPAAE